MFVISYLTKVVGSVETTEPVLIDGTFNGTMDCGATIKVTGRAVVSGVLVADVIDIDGQVVADIYAQRIVLSDTATVRGRLFHADLVLEKNTFFEGQSRRIKNPRAAWHSGKAP